MLLLERQLVFLGKVLREDPSHPLREVSFTPDTLQPATSRYVRRVGRPRYEWVSRLLPQAYVVAGGAENLMVAVQNDLSWKAAVKARACCPITGH